MSDKVLVAYASRVGSTKEVARAIAHALLKRGVKTDLHALKDVEHVDDYRAVVLGSAIRFGKVLPEIQHFVEAHRVALKHIPVAYFVLCMTLEEDSEINRQTAHSYLDPLTAMVPAVDVALFAGKVDEKKLAPVLRVLVKAMHAPQGDFRDWAAIHRWADSLPPLLVDQVAASS